MTGQTDKIAEHVGLERELIGSVLDAGSWAQILCSKLSEAAFQDWAARQGYQAIEAILRRGEEVGLVSLNGELVNRGQLEAWKALAIAFEGTDRVCTVGAFEQALEVVRTRAFRRFSMAALRRCAEEVKDPRLDPEAIHRRCAAHINYAMAGAKKTWPENVATTLAALRDGLLAPEDAQEGPAVYLPTPWPNLNRRLRGLGLGRYVGIAGLPGSGKTSAGLQTMASMAAPDRPGLIFSHEMSKAEVCLRLASQFCQKPVNAIEASPELLSHAIEWAESRGLYVYDEPIGYHQIPSVVEGFKMQHPGLSSVMVDYLTRYADNDHKEVARASKVVHALARRHNVVMVVLLQFTKYGEKEPNPGLEHLIGSSQIRQDLAQGFIVRREHRAGFDPSAARLEIAKNRFGDTGHVKLSWCGPTTTFTAYQKPAEPPEPEQGELPEGVEVPL